MNGSRSSDTTTPQPWEGSIDPARLPFSGALHPPPATTVDETSTSDEHAPPRPNLPHNNTFGMFSHLRPRIELPLPVNDFLPDSTRRFPGDGLDFRRPVMADSSNPRGGPFSPPRWMARRIPDRNNDEDGGRMRRTQDNVIDLTNDADSSPPVITSQTRPRRNLAFPRDVINLGDPEVIDLEASPGSSNARDTSRGQENNLRNNAPADSPSSPEVQFLRAERIQRPQSTIQDPNPGRPEAGSARYSGGSGSMYEWSASLGPMSRLADFLRGNGLGTAVARDVMLEEAARRAYTPPRELLDDLFVATGRTPHPTREFEARRRRRLQSPGLGRFNSGLDDLTIHMDMNYEITGFNLANGRNARAASPEYRPPAAAQEGFTTSPAEEEIVVCPNCDDELAVGESETKQQIWVSKACGHVGSTSIILLFLSLIRFQVYCGECNLARGSAKRKAAGKMPSRAPPLQKCVVDGCGKPLTGKTALIQVYL